MKAAVLKAFGSPLAVETVPDPVLGTGEVIVDVAATRARLCRRGLQRRAPLLLELPVIPGAGGIGRVRAVGPDATGSPSATGCSAIPRCAPATMPWRPTSSCRA